MLHRTLFIYLLFSDFLHDATLPAEKITKEKIILKPHMLFTLVLNSYNEYRPGGRIVIERILVSFIYNQQQFWDV